MPFAMFRARSFSKKVVKRLGFALTDFVPENLKTKMQGAPVGAGFRFLACAYSCERCAFFLGILHVFFVFLRKMRDGWVTVW